MNLITRLTPFVLLLSGGCADVDHDHDDHDHDHGAVTTLVLLFTPTDGGETLEFTWADPDAAADPEVDDILLPDASDHNHHDAQTYDLAVEVYNELEDPVEDVTPEIADQADQHQFFFTGSAVEGPATGANGDAIIQHDYADADSDGLPLGMDNSITTLDWGSGELVVTLRHLPLEDGEPVKVDGLAEDVASDGFSAIGGDNDIQVTFPITVE